MQTSDTGLAPARSQACQLLSPLCSCSESCSRLASTSALHCDRSDRVRQLGPTPLKHCACSVHDLVPCVPRLSHGVWVGAASASLYQACSCRARRSASRSCSALCLDLPNQPQALLPGPQLQLRHPARPPGCRSRGPLLVSCAAGLGLPNGRALGHGTACRLNPPQALIPHLKLKPRPPAMLPLVLAATATPAASPMPGFFRPALPTSAWISYRGLLYLSTFLPQVVHGLGAPQSRASNPACRLRFLFGCPVVPWTMSLASWLPISVHLAWLQVCPVTRAFPRTPSCVSNSALAFWLLPLAL